MKQVPNNRFQADVKENLQFSEKWWLHILILRFRFTAARHQTFQVPSKWRNPHLYKQYGYGLCKGKSTPKIAKNKVQETLHFRYLKFLVSPGPLFSPSFSRSFTRFEPSHPRFGDIALPGLLVRGGHGGSLGGVWGWGSH